MSTFTWTPDFGAEQDNKPNVSRIKFGDGYEQRAAFGMNTNPQVWNLQFSNRDISEITAIDDFLRARGGVESFDWTPPRASDPLKFVCMDWSRGLVSAAYDSLSATFEQVFEP